MKKLTLLILLAIGFWSCEQEEFDTSSIDGQWILTNISCFCNFGMDPQFDQHYIWIDSEQSLMLANGTGTNVFRARGTIYSFEIEGSTFSLEGENKTYTIEVTDDRLTLVYNDDPMIADDEISYTFTKGTADASCIDFSMVEQGACTKEYVPVCGCDGITYGNSCEAGNAGVQSWEEGACSD